MYNREKRCLECLSKLIHSVQISFTCTTKKFILKPMYRLREEFIFKPMKTGYRKNDIVESIKEFTRFSCALILY